MASRKLQAAVYFLLFVTLVVVQVSTSVGETASASAEEDVCDVNPNPDPKLTNWKEVKKTRKGVCPKGEEPTCESCELHTFKKKKGFHKKCQACSKGFGTVDTGNVKCIGFCKAGRFFNSSVYSEDYSPAPMCKDGLYKNCPKGECQECPVGTYMPMKCLKKECRPCPNNQTTAGTGTQKREDCGYLCPAGEQGNEALGGCEPCPEGTYKEEVGVGKCQSCGDKFTTMTDGASNKTRDCVRKCDVGKEYTIKEGAEEATCEKCTAGTFKAEPGNRLGCEPCGVNRKSEKGATTCEVECSEGWEPNGRDCRTCDFGWYKPKQENASCTQCGMAGSVRRVTKQRGSTNKAACVKLDSCVQQGANDLGGYYALVADMNNKGEIAEDANIVSFMKDMCFTDVSIIINKIVETYRTCEDCHQLALDDITIGSRSYKGEVQKALFIEAAKHGNGTGHYCHYFSCMVSHMKEFEKCKGIMEVDPDMPLEYCSIPWRAGALCIMLNVKNCPPLRYYPDVTDDARLDGMLADDVYKARKIQTICSGEILE